MEKDIKSNQKIAGLDILISEKADYQNMEIIRDKERELHEDKKAISPTR